MMRIFTNHLKRMSSHAPVLIPVSERHCEPSHGVLVHLAEKHRSSRWELTEGFRSLTDARLQGPTASWAGTDRTRMRDFRPLPLGTCCRQDGAQHSLLGTPRPRAQHTTRLVAVTPICELNTTAYQHGLHHTEDPNSLRG